MALSGVPAAVSRGQSFTYGDGEQHRWSSSTRPVGGGELHAERAGTATLTMTLRNSSGTPVGTATRTLTIN